MLLFFFFKGIIRTIFYEPYGTQYSNRIHVDLHTRYEHKNSMAIILVSTTYKGRNEVPFNSLPYQKDFFEIINHIRVYQYITSDNKFTITIRLFTLKCTTICNSNYVISFIEHQLLNAQSTFEHILATPIPTPTPKPSR